MPQKKVDQYLLKVQMLQSPVQVSQEVIQLPQVEDPFMLKGTMQILSIPTSQCPCQQTKVEQYL